MEFLTKRAAKQSSELFQLRRRQQSGLVVDRNLEQRIAFGRSFGVASLIDCVLNEVDVANGWEFGEAPSSLPSSTAVGKEIRQKVAARFL
jgi:hypothetical protein